MLNVLFFLYFPNPYLWLQLNGRQGQLVSLLRFFLWLLTWKSNIDGTSSGLKVSLFKDQRISTFKYQYLDILSENFLAEVIRAKSRVLFAALPVFILFVVVCTLLVQLAKVKLVFYRWWESEIN